MSDEKAKPQAWSRRPKPFLSIRARLLVLALLAIAPLLLERVHGLEAARGARTVRANADVVDLARRGVEAQRDIISSTRAILQIVTRVFAKIQIDRSNCSQYMTGLTANIPWIRDVSVAATDGRIVCSTDPVAIGLNVSDRPHFMTALHSREFALSNYLINRVNQVPSLVATFPVIADDSSIKGVALAVINLQWIGDLASTAAERPGASVVLLDGNGTLVAGSADQQRFIGQRFAGDGLAKEMLAEDEGTITTTGFDGVRRIFAYVRVPWTNARLAVGLDDTAVHSGIDSKINLAYLQLFL